ncbi:hypothetical protein PLICRDRAFT_179055 [Plicaturopsis crispa FD-325 SS-3]|uniref:CCHC-type domain-containing protein n=1 Tax=Plicaturopsis crispa FD-325 SS-3 TaxID=944288 RepID=A0A0C9T5W5_PLICR|nr:hypothetical protein PLICRDRAFT_179055 [Plicaturopsis crispa FD-325 SS-3]
MAPGGSRGGLYFARGGPPRPAGTGRGGGAPGRPSLRGRLIADRYRDLKANSSPPVPDTDEGRAAYRTQVSAWMRTNSGFEPDEQHPYPLSPGTSAAGTNECFRCGKGGHRSVVCQAPPMPGLEQRWRSIATCLNYTYINYVGNAYGGAASGYHHYDAWDEHWGGSSYPGEVDDVPGNGEGPSA